MTPRVKPWEIQSALTFDSMDGTVSPFIGMLLITTLLQCCLLLNFTMCDSILCSFFLLLCDK